MNPIDYWYEKDRGIQKCFADYVEDTIDNPVLGDDMRKDIRLLLAEGSVEEKCLAITVLAMVKKYFG